MGNHRADHRGPRRSPSETPYAGRRIAGRPVPTSEPFLTCDAADTVPAPAPAASQDQTTVFHDFDATASLPMVQAEPGRRRAVRHAGSRGSLFKGLPSVPVLVGIAALAVSAGGAVTMAEQTLVTAEQPRVTQASALSGASGAASVNLLSTRGPEISRSSRRDALEQAADAKLEKAVEKQYRQRNATLAQFATQAEKYAAEIKMNQWVLPIDGYRLTATYGQVGLWASYHTGLDFAAPSGTPIKAIANGVITETGYDGSYGNKTVLTLEDGTEIWFCHQTTMLVSTGDVVRAGEQIGTVGSTGNSTGPHLHLEVRPGAGDPVDPHSALQVHGLQP